MIQITRDVKIKNIANIVNAKSPSFSGIVSGESKGNLWVDNLEEPKLALVWSYAVGGFAFLGTSEAKEDYLNLKDFLENELFYHLKKNGSDCFEFSVESEGIHNYILDIFKDRSIQTEKEFSLRTNETPINHRDIPQEYELRKVNDVFWKSLKEGKFENESFLKTRLLESWYSFEDFKKNSISYCTIFENRIVSVMVGTGCFNKVLAIDIETEEKHRGKGLAYVMAEEFISDCLKNEFVPQWDCVESNTNSYYLAEKLGFKKTFESTVYSFDI